MGRCEVAVALGRRGIAIDWVTEPLLGPFGPRRARRRNVQSGRSEWGEAAALLRAVLLWDRGP